MGRPATKADVWSDLFVEQGNGCWEWGGTRNSDGYGKVSIKSKGIATHVLSFRLHHLREPVGILRHTCDNRACYRPDHLTEGTNKQNSQDMVERDHHARGERSGTSKLTALQVLEIRERCASGELDSSIAPDYGVTAANIYLIRKRKTWADERNFT